MTPLFLSGTFWDLSIIKEHFTNLITPNLDNNPIFAKVLFLNTMIQSCAFKYIFDLASEQSEIEVNNHSLDIPSLS